MIAGGGLAGALAALAMARHRPDVPLMIVEEGETFGGEGVRAFTDAELGQNGAELIGPLAIERWPGFYVAFPGFSRNLGIAYAGFGAVDLHRALVELLEPRQYRLGVKVVAVREDALSSRRRGDQGAGRDRRPRRPSCRRSTSPRGAAEREYRSRRRTGSTGRC